MRLEPVQRGVQPVGEREAGHVAVQPRAEDDEVFGVLRRVGARGRHYRRLNDAEDRKPQYEQRGERDAKGALTDKVIKGRDRRGERAERGH